MKDWEERFVQALDVDYSYRLAKRMEEHKTNEDLGYRTAGSRAEFETGEMLRLEMERIGLTDVRKDRVDVDAWEFERAKMSFLDALGKEYHFQLGAYQTNFDTHGAKEYELIWLGKGGAKDYEGKDVTGKLVMVDINQREEWWINFPVYQAKLKGAAALIAVQEQGYGEIDSKALNAQDIAGPSDAPAFSMSQADANILKQAMAKTGSVCVTFDAKTTVTRDRETYNIVGTILGRETDRQILLSAHYDSYFSGFQDDNAAIAMMLGIARALVQSGYQPRYNLVFCAMAAEEWGVVNSKYDWSTGAYEQVFTARPEWRTKTVADLNFELPAHAHGRQDGVRCTYEYEDFVKHFLEDITVDPEAFPEGIRVRCPIQTWSDDFSMAIAGIPSMVNEFANGEFMETHYHSQFDNDDFYQEPVYRFHHMLYGRMVMAIDRLAVAPMNFERLFEAIVDSDDVAVRRKTEADFWGMKHALKGARETARNLYTKIETINAEYEQMLVSGDEAGASAWLHRWEKLGDQLLFLFQKEQDYFVRLNWQDEVLFPQEAVQNNLRSIFRALTHLEENNPKAALEDLYSIDNNCYAFQFDEEVFDYFTQYVLDQPKDRLKWGTGRIVHHENLFHLVKRLKEKQVGESLEEEKAMLQKVADSQCACYRDDIRYMTEAIRKMTAWMQECLDM